ncbi:hypothetical protein, partial [Kitasatospora aureofaciens]|uniref:hypothetical protein n=1 Tax=Kitasatospora aureofaciens TaxID=1894 RepID=UPI00131E5BE6
VYLAFARLLDGYATDWDWCHADHPGTVLDEYALAVARQLLGTSVCPECRDTGACNGGPCPLTADAAAALGDGAVRCPLCPGPLMLHTPSGARALFAHGHPEQQIRGRQGPWPVLVDAAPP